MLRTNKSSLFKMFPSMLQSISFGEEGIGLAAIPNWNTTHYFKVFICSLRA
jgi:hypothetical protein